MIEKDYLTGWTPYQLSDIYTERREPGNDTLPMLTVSIHDGVSDGELDDDELGKKVRRIADKTQYRVAKPGDLVFNMMRAWQGAIGVARSEGMVSPAYIVAKPNDKVYPLFMDYYMKTPRMVGIINRQSYGVTDFRKRLYWDSFAPINVMLPPIAEQKKIAAILTTQDKVIELKEKIIQEKRKQKKQTFTTLIKASSTSLPLSSLAKVTMGQSPSSDSYNDTQEGIPLIQGNADINNRLPAPRLYTNKPTKYCQPDDILLSVRAPVGTVAKSNIVACIGRGICSIHPSQMGEYLYEYLMYFEDRWGKVSQGSTFDSISGDEINKLLIPIPQNILAATRAMSLATTELTLLQQDLDQEKQKKKALMQLLLTGKARVR